MRLPILFLTSPAFAVQVQPDLQTFTRRLMSRTSTLAVLAAFDLLALAGLIVLLN